VGLGSYIAEEKPGLRAENVVKRLEWAKRYKDWTMEDWKHFIWSDESNIWIGVNLHLPHFCGPFTLRCTVYGAVHVNSEKNCFPQHF
jgi:hypothetical protein